VVAGLALAVRLVPLLLGLVFGSTAPGHRPGPGGVHRTDARFAGSPEGQATTASDVSSAVPIAGGTTRLRFGDEPGNADTRTPSSTPDALASDGAGPSRQYGGVTGLVGSILDPGRNIIQQDVASNRTVVVDGGSSLIRISHDDGATFGVISMPSACSIGSATFAADFAASRTIYALAVSYCGGAPAMLRSLDAGLTFSTLPASGLPSSMQVTTIAGLSNGQLLAGLALWVQNAGFGIRCSADGGATWQLAC